MENFPRRKPFQIFLLPTGIGKRGRTKNVFYFSFLSLPSVSKLGTSCFSFFFHNIGWFPVVIKYSILTYSCLYIYMYVRYIVKFRTSNYVIDITCFNTVLTTSEFFETITALGIGTKWISNFNIHLPFLVFYQIALYFVARFYRINIRRKRYLIYKCYSVAYICRISFSSKMCWRGLVMKVLKIYHFSSE